MKKILLLLFFIYALNSNAQIFKSIGTIPPGIKWKQINTDTVRVVFPNGLESKAQRLTNLIHFLAKNNKTSIGKKKEKIDIFLINTGSGSNGFVSPAPYHSKFYTMPPQYPFAGTVDWLDLLGIHEYRHVMQMNNSKHGFTGLLKYVFGDFAWSIGMFGAVPSWFWEGDAVQQETALSYSGRGRLPLFKDRFLTIMDLKTPFGYEKMRCGSFRNYVPNHYVLGYQMVNYGRRKFGNNLWKKVFSEAVSYKSVLWPFSYALKKQTGFSTKKMYSEIVKSYKNNEENMPFFIAFAPDKYKSEIKKNNPVFYYSPHFISNDKIIAIKSSFNHAAKFVEINIENKKEKNIYPVSYNFGSFDTDGKKLIWNEINTDPRWAYVSYSNIYSYDIETKTVAKLTSGNRYFSPSISPDGDKICVFEADENMRYKILILDTKSGKKIKELDNPENYFYRNLDWIDATHIISIAAHNNKNALVKIDIEDSDISELIPFTYTTMQDLRYNDNKVFFSAPDPDFSDKQTLYYYDLKKRNINKFNQQSDYAAFSPDFSDNGKLVYCDLKFDNTVLKVKDAEVIFDALDSDNLDRDYEIEDDKILEAEGGSILEKVPQNKFKIEKYSTAKHLLNFHSWYPLSNAVEYSAVFQSNDKLDKLSLKLVPAYNINEKSFALGTYVDYGGIYPVFSLGFVPKFNIHNIINGQKYISNYIQMKAVVSLPLSYTRLNYVKKINANLVYNSFQYWHSNNSELNNYSNQSLNLDFFYSNHKKSSYRSFYPDFGYDVSINLGNINTDHGFNSLLGHTKIYLPGFFANNSIQLRYDFLAWTGKDRISNMVSKYYFAKGYQMKNIENMVNGLKINYSFPVAYPDFALDKFVFIKRIRANIYFDVDRFENNSIKAQYKRSAGIEFLFDNVYFRSFSFPFGFGVDYLFDNDTGQKPVNLRLILEF